MEKVFIQSRLLEPEEIQSTGAFTTLPIRIHKRNDIADASSTRVLKDWGCHVKDGMEKRVVTSFGRVGNLNSFAFTEALPERLAIVAYLLDLGFIHDGDYISLVFTQTSLYHEKSMQKLLLMDHIMRRCFRSDGP